MMNDSIQCVTQESHTHKRSWALHFGQSHPFMGLQRRDQRLLQPLLPGIAWVANWFARRKLLKIKMFGTTTHSLVNNGLEAPEAPTSQGLACERQGHPQRRYTLQGAPPPLHCQELSQGQEQPPAKATPAPQVPLSLQWLTPLLDFEPAKLRHLQASRSQGRRSAADEKFVRCSGLLAPTPRSGPQF